jgi:hypothetical protein
MHPLFVPAAAAHSLSNMRPVHLGIQGLMGVVTFVVARPARGHNIPPSVWATITTRMKVFGSGFEPLWATAR